MLTFNIPELETMVAFVFGFVYPFIVDKLGFGVSVDKRILMFMGGILGAAIAVGVNYLSVWCGLGEMHTLNELLIIGFGVTIPTSEGTYRTIIKPRNEEKNNA